MLAGWQRSVWLRGSHRPSPQAVPFPDVIASLRRTAGLSPSRRRGQGRGSGLDSLAVRRHDLAGPGRGLSSARVALPGCGGAWLRLAASGRPAACRGRQLAGWVSVTGGVLASVAAVVRVARVSGWQATAALRSSRPLAGAATRVRGRRARLFGRASGRVVPAF